MKQREFWIHVSIVVVVLAVVLATDLAYRCGYHYDRPSMAR